MSFPRRPPLPEVPPRPPLHEFPRRPPLPKIPTRASVSRGSPAGRRSTRSAAPPVAPTDPVVLRGQLLPRRRAAAPRCEAATVSSSPSASPFPRDIHRSAVESSPSILLVAFVHGKFFMEGARLRGSLTSTMLRQPFSQPLATCQGRLLHCEHVVSGHAVFLSAILKT
ncbi:hypothetical protein BRADI_4g27425v3 [Brachypodium distachyon]|uniref:Uncharacterized protein n=1 Tax=Brachypodium distachyon TaxID=15368 RepID=A0A2K2CQL5_BRADI|nr:hypothetical protein BRADI_4g27425v3 [Brachypodium distachyon]